jgi:GntR family transcriptional regulator
VITVDDTNPMPAFEQVRSQLANQILLGTLSAGERLPTVRQLASDLGLAPGTIARAYALLESEGLIETGRGAGTRVHVQADQYPDVLDAALDFIETAKSHNLDLERTILAIRAAWDPSPPRPHSMHGRQTP